METRNKWVEVSIKILWYQQENIKYHQGYKFPAIIE